jgi:predicted alpha-1,2-mannosidase
MRYFVILTMVMVFFSCQTKDPIQQSQEFTQDGIPLCEKVNPFIGTGGHGHTYPGATRPFGMVQLSPDTRLDGWDGCGGYHYTDSLIFGFSHTHLQGTGVSDYGDVLFMPTNNQVRKGNNWGERYLSAFQKETEQAHAGYYSVHLDDHNITAELTATERVGIHRYSFDSPDSCVLFIDMAHRDELLGYQLEPRGDSMIVGFRQSQAWAENQYVFFAAKFSKPFEFLDQTYEVVYTEDPLTGEITQEIELVPVFPLNFQVVDTLMVQVALSSSSIEGAIKNLNAEATHWNFDDYKTDAEEAWNKELSGIQVEMDSKEDEEIFYTALYHSYTVPNMWSDVDGVYRGIDNQLYQMEGHFQYTVFSLWDTFRATHPLYTITQRDRSTDFVNSFLNMYRQGGKLPMWELAGNYTGCMIGYHSVPVIADAYAKGITGFDTDLALEAMLSTAYSGDADVEPELGKDWFVNYGYIPSNEEHESVSKTLEYSYDDWCIARFAEAIGNDFMATKFDQRSLNYRNIYNSKTKFFQPRNGAAFLPNFNPEEVNFNFTEANAWQYNFFVPHDVTGHINLMGGEANYSEMLDSLFHTNAEVAGRQQADITGLIGQYAHGNEPSHHMAYLYPFIGEQWKTAELVDQIMDDLYTNQPDGLSGNEDCGQMSSWYVLSALGFYPVAPGDVNYVIGAPRVNKATLHLENGNKLNINVIRGSKDDIYIDKISWNNAPYDKSYISHNMLMSGGYLTFMMRSTPNKEFGTKPENRPASKTADANFVMPPAIDAPVVFRDSTEVRIYCADTSATIRYRMNDGWKDYSAPFTIYDQVRIYTHAVKSDYTSIEFYAEPVKITQDISIELQAEYDNQYTAGGDDALIDGIMGNANFKTGLWQGYYGKDFVAILDLKKRTNIKTIRLRALQDIKPWIWYPSAVEYYASADGIDFRLFETVLNPNPVDSYELGVYPFESIEPLTTRFIKIVAKSFGTIPDWHLGRGNDSWLFIDEIQIEEQK